MMNQYIGLFILIVGFGIITNAIHSLMIRHLKVKVMKELVKYKKSGDEQILRNLFYSLK